VLVVTEFALSLVLMIAAGLLLRSFWDLYKVPLGFDPQHVMAVRTWLPIPTIPKTDIYGTLLRRRRFFANYFAAAGRCRECRKQALGSERVHSAGSPSKPDPLILEGREAGASSRLWWSVESYAGVFSFAGNPAAARPFVQRRDNEKRLRSR
jgi:hypothetical protein